MVGLPGSKQAGGAAREGGAQHIDARFTIGARHSLATKVMSNGVEVIVAGKCMDLTFRRYKGEAGGSLGRSSLLTTI